MRLNLLIFFIFGIFSFILSQDCNKVYNPQTYKDCSPYDTKATFKICCWIRGVYGGNNGTACLLVDDLFKDKLVTYTLDGLTGSMICGDLTSTQNYIKVSIYFLLILLFLIL